MKVRGWKCEDEKVRDENAEDESARMKMPRMKVWGWMCEDESARMKVWGWKCEDESARMKYLRMKYQRMKNLRMKKPRMKMQGWNCEDEVSRSHWHPTPCLVLNPFVNFLSRLAPFISWTLVSFSTLFRHFFTPGSSLGVSGGNGHKYASHTTSLLASHTWNGLLLSFFKKSKASKSLSTLFYERKESLWNDLVSWFKPLQSALLV